MGVLVVGWLQKVELCQCIPTVESTQGIPDHREGHYFFIGLVVVIVDLLGDPFRDFGRQALASVDYPIGRNFGVGFGIQDYELVATVANTRAVVVTVVVVGIFNKFLALGHDCFSQVFLLPIGSQISVNEHYQMEERCSIGRRFPTLSVWGSVGSGNGSAFGFGPNWKEHQ